MNRSSLRVRTSTPVELDMTEPQRLKCALVELDSVAELGLLKSLQVTKLSESISQAENAGSIPVTRSRKDGQLGCLILEQSRLCLTNCEGRDTFRP